MRLICLPPWHNQKNSLFGLWLLSGFMLLYLKWLQQFDRRPNGLFYVVYLPAVKTFCSLNGLINLGLPKCLVLIDRFNLMSSFTVRDVLTLLWVWEKDMGVFLCIYLCCAGKAFFFIIVSTFTLVFHPFTLYSHLMFFFFFLLYWHPFSPFFTTSP